ncbi:hypothetical protein C7E18_22735, partial [Stenotrophomonas maltophilia]
LRRPAQQGHRQAAPQFSGWGIGLAIFQQLVGINVVFYYGAVLWQAVGFSESGALLINVLRRPAQQGHRQAAPQFSGWGIGLAIFQQLVGI